MSNYVNKESYFLESESQLFKAIKESDETALGKVFSTLSEDSLSNPSRIVYSAMKMFWHSGKVISVEGIVNKVCSDEQLQNMAFAAFSVKAPTVAEQERILQTRLKMALEKAVTSADAPSVDAVDLAEAIQDNYYTSVDERSRKEAIEQLKSGATISSVIDYLYSVANIPTGYLGLERFDYTSPRTDIGALVSRMGVPVIVRGNLHFIVGEAKTFKTHVAVSMMGACLGADPELCLGFEASDGVHKVLHVDTEQSDGDLYANARLVLSKAGMDDSVQHEEYVVYSLIPYSAAERMDRVLTCIAHEKPDIVFIDGLVDLVDDFNDLGKCKRAIDSLYAAACSSGSAIVLVLHFNPGSTRARGHLGTILMQKAWGGLALCKNILGITVYNGGLCRAREISPFNITFDEERGDVVLSDKTVVSRSAQKEAKKIENDNFIMSLFNSCQQLTRATIMSSLMYHYGIEEKNKTTAGRMVDHAVKSGVITKLDDGMYALVEPVASFEEDMPDFLNEEEDSDEEQD